MRGLLVVLPCAACNSLFGLDPASEHPIDAPDAAIDAAHYACTPLPTFTTLPVRLLPGLADYTADIHGDTRETAWNAGPPAAIQEEVPGQGPFIDAQFSDSTTAVDNAAPRLTPSGEQLFVRTALGPAQQYEFRFYVRGSAGWTDPIIIAFQSAAVLISPTDVLSTPSQNEVERRIILTQSTPSKKFIEFFDQDGTNWKEVDMGYAPQTFSVDDFSDPYLSPDALALAFVGVKSGVSAVYIVVRTGMVQFAETPATLLFQPPPGMPIKSPWLNRDCSRLYFTSSDGVYYTTP